MLEHNVKEFKNCTVHKTALGNTNGSVSMKYETHSGTNHISSFDGDIKLKTLDSYSFTEIDIIKISSISNKGLKESILKIYKKLQLL